MIARVMHRQSGDKRAQLDSKAAEADQKTETGDELDFSTTRTGPTTTGSPRQTSIPSGIVKSLFGRDHVSRYDT